ncbi:DNA-binding response regulator [Clostridiales bacterium COT073_COT-073]|nr:DNA-binding response regulator [Clostridiales bacterium COT073_COT-073]
MKVLVVDDEKNIVELIRRNLKMEGYEVVSAYCGKEAMQRVIYDKPDIVLLDVMMPDMDGYEVLQKIQEYDVTIPVIFITAQGKNYKKVAALELGADDFITKPLNMKELALKIKVLWRRINYSKMPAENKIQYLEYDKIIIDARIRKVFVEGESRELTYKEFDTLYYLASHYAYVLTREKLLNEIWGFDYAGNTRAVDILIQRLRAKIAPCDNYIQTVYGIGYKFEQE